MDGVARILLVDGDAESRERAASTLRETEDQFAVVEETTAAGAIKYLADEHVDGVVSEVKLPDSDGLALLDHVRTEHPELPFVLFTDRGSDATAAEAFTAGATDYLPKGGGGYRALPRRLQQLVPTNGGGPPATGDAGKTAGDTSESAVSNGGGSDGREGLARNYRALIDTVPGIVYRARVDAEWPFEFVDGACEEITGYTSEELQTTVDWGSEVLHPEDRERATRVVTEAIEAGEAFQLAYRIHTKDGELRWLWEQGREADQPSVIEGFISDITEHKRREQQLERERERFSDLFENFPEPTVAYELDEDGKTVFRAANDAFEETFEFEEEAILDERINDTIVPEERRGESMDIDQKIEDGEMVDREVRRQTASESRIFNLRNIPVTVGGEIDGFAVYTDITDRKLRERELERYETIVETMPMGILVVDEDGEVVNVNEPAAEIIGYETEDLLDRPFATFVEEGVVDESVIGEYKDAVETLRSPMYSKDKAVLETEITRVDGETRDIEVYLSLLPYEESFNGSVQVYHDITDRRQNERELKRQNERLEEFASIVSHDLRNPLNVAKGHLDLVSRDCDSEHIGTIGEALDRMEALISETLELARQGETVTETEPLELSEAVDGCWEMVATGDATLERKADATIHGDPERIKQLFENLFRNAVEHGSTGNRSETDDAVEHGSTSSQPPADDAVEHGSTGSDSQARRDAVGPADPDVSITVGVLDDGLYVADDGPGIPPEERERVFEPGFTTGEDGTGFGLSIIRSIVEAHDWEIRVVESENGGARFEITGMDMSA